MRWLLILMLLTIGCTKTVSAPPSPQESPKEIFTEGESIKFILPFAISEYEKRNVSCTLGVSCSAVYTSYSVSEKNVFTINFNSTLDENYYCSPSLQTGEWIYQGREVKSCITKNTQEKVSSHIWWAEPHISNGVFISIIEEDVSQRNMSIREYSTQVRVNSTTRGLIDNIDKFVMQNRKLALKE